MSELIYDRLIGPIIWLASLVGAGVGSKELALLLPIPEWAQGVLAGGLSVAAGALFAVELLYRWRLGKSQQYRGRT